MRGGRIPKRGPNTIEESANSLRDQDLTEVRLIVCTQPDKVGSIPSKTPEIMEIGLVGGDLDARLDWAMERLGGQIGLEDVYEVGQEVDVVGVTKGLSLIHI